MTQINLLPGDVRQRQRTRRLTLLVAGGTAVALVFLSLVFLLQSARLSGARQELAKQQALNEGLRSDIAGLEQFRQLKQSLAERETLAGQLLQGEVLWSGVLRDLSLVIPGQMWLTQFSGTLNQVAGTTTAPTTSSLVGKIDFSGVALDQQTVALWLTRLEDVKGWVNPWISSSSSAEGTGTQTGVQFTGTVDLGPEATADGGRS